jgi:predicted GH43/DUF377 family glycosyl hydrolase
MKAKRAGIIIKPDCTRVLFRPFDPTSKERILKIISRIIVFSEAEVKTQLQQVLQDFSSRHVQLEQFFLKRFEQIRQYLITDNPLTRERKLLIGAYFTQEYSLESAALFNPSIVWHPDQSGLPEGSRRFILSLRATGEGHISSITFRTGVVDKTNTITINKPAPFVKVPEIQPHPFYEKKLFERKLYELNLDSDYSSQVVAELKKKFTIKELMEIINYTLSQSRNREDKTRAQGILSLAQSNYEVIYSPDQPLSARIIFPSTPAESRGIEDARFTQFQDDDNVAITYYATYTAFNGSAILPQLLETKDFLRFKISTLNGPEVRNKGMALFPRKINGLYAMISRQDNENVYIMFSEQIHFWYTKKLILKPSFPWEFVQMGNCGSPIETQAGWLVLGHGVGPMRKYCISAFLLDLNDPTKVIGRLKQPLITPNDNEREGYVPNVVYSCGSIINGHELIIPYAMSDYATSFATVNLDALLHELVANSG